MTEEHRRWMWRLRTGCISLPLVITLAFMIRSFFTVDGFSCLLWDLETFHGEIYVTDNAKDFFPVPPGIDFEGNQLLGFGLRYSDKMGTVACIPLWAFIGVEVSFVALWMRRPLRRGRGRSGHCLNCNYDLRASQDCCPECGTRFGAALIVKPPPPARFTR